MNVKKLKLSDYYNKQKKEIFIKDLYESFLNTGFVVIENEKVPPKLIDLAYNKQKEFFKLPLQSKMHYHLNNGGLRGYTPYKTENAAGSSVKDLKEFFHIGRNVPKSDSYMQTPYIYEIDFFNDTFNLIFKQLEATSNIILEALTYSFDAPQDFFSNATNKSNSILRLLHYPPVPDIIEQNQIRAQAHTDINLITCLLAGKGSGLEIFTNNSWIPVVSNPHEIVVNMGDMLSRMTNYVLPSTIHRVINPIGDNPNRYSMPFFHHPNDEFIIQELDKYKNIGTNRPPITAKDFLNERLKEIGLK